MEKKRTQKEARNSVGNRNPLRSYVVSDVYVTHAIYIVIISYDPG